ncbi:MAG TPA: cell division protein FtsZ [Candidatus Lokiarchaeia archaeon]|nr:cell division protein FtsZ [Candidatus Lokiarchaeia archaeon]
MEPSEEPENPVDANVFNVQLPNLDLTRAVQRMEAELPVVQPIRRLRPLQDIPSLPRVAAIPAQHQFPGAKQMLYRKTIPVLPPLPDIPFTGTPRKSDLLDLLDSDDDLKDLLDKRDIRTLVVGVGGAGNNMISRFQELSIPKCRTLCVNTDVQDLYYSNADEKILIGKRITKGLGTGNNFEIGELAAREDYERLKAVMDADVVFLTGGMGGGTGTGATPLVAKAAKDRGAIVVSIVTMPFKMEGPTKETVAYQGLKNLAESSDTVIPLANQKLLDFVPDIKIHQGFKIMDEVLLRSVRSIIELVTKPGLVNLDFADIKSIIEKRGRDEGDTLYSTSVIGMTEVSQIDDEHLKTYTTKALNNPLIDPDIGGIKNALVGIIGDYNVNLRQVDTVVSTVQEQIHPSASVKWGFIQDPSLKGKLRITVMGSGFKSPFMEHALNMTADMA